MPHVPRSHVLLFTTMAALGASVDLATKWWAFRALGMPHEKPSYWVFDEIFGFTTSLNEGALFGIGQGRGLVFCGLSLAALCGIAYWLTRGKALHDWLLSLALGMVTGGILGNLYDRLGLPKLTWGADMFHQPGTPVYAVRDWLHFKVDGVVDWPIFNIADSLLVVGAVLLVWHALAVEPEHAVEPASSGQDAPIA